MPLPPPDCPDEPLKEYIRDLEESRTELERQKRNLTLLVDYALSVNRSLEVDQVLDYALNDAIQRGAFEWAAVYRLDEGGRPQTAGFRNASPDLNTEIEKFRLRQGAYLAAGVIESGEALFIPDMAGDKRFKGLWGQPDQPRAYIILPLLSKGYTIGALELTYGPGRSLSELHVKLLRVIAHELGAAMDNALLLAEARASEREVEALYQIGTRISASLDRAQVLAAVAEGARDLLNAEIGLIGLLDGSGENVVIEAAAGLGAEAMQGMRLPAQGDALNETLGSKAVLLEQDEPGPPLPRSFEKAIAKAQVGSFLAAPLARGQKLLGVIGVISNRRRRFTPRELRLLERLAVQVVVSVENAQLYERTRILTVQSERNRLAAEMHDNLAQALAGIHLSLARIDQQIAGGQIDSAAQSLQGLREFAEETYTEIRAGIFNLRSEIAPGLEFIPSLEKYLAEFGTRFGLQTGLQVEPGLVVDLPAAVSVQVGRVLQEALANIRKHAQAGRVSVSVGRAGGRLRLAVEDDGVGFEAGAADPAAERGMGLQIMRERLAGVGGELAIESALGCGARVCIYLTSGWEKGNETTDAH